MSAIRRDMNVKKLTALFPLLKIFQIRAALTLTRHELDKAGVLLQVYNSYQHELTAVDREQYDLTAVKLMFEKKNQEAEVHNNELNDTIDNLVGLIDSTTQSVEKNPLSNTGEDHLQ